MDPATLAMLNAGSNVLGKALSPASAPSRADGYLDSSFNSSGWSVAFNGDASASASQNSVPWWVLAAAALVVIAWAAKRK